MIDKSKTDFSKYRYIIEEEVIVFDSKALYIDDCYCDEKEDILIGNTHCESGHIAYNNYWKYEELPAGKMERM